MKWRLGKGNGVRYDMHLMHGSEMSRKMDVLFMRFSELILSA